MTEALRAWTLLEAEVNGRSFVGMPGVRDPESPCEGFDGRHYDGGGRCKSDGHYLCVECSELSPRAYRFTETRAGRGDRLRLFWARRVA